MVVVKKETEMNVDFEITLENFSDSCSILETELASVLDYFYMGIFCGDCYLQMGGVDFSLLDGRDDNEPFPIVWFLKSLSFIAKSLDQGNLEPLVLEGLEGQFFYSFELLSTSNPRVATIRELHGIGRIATFEIDEFLLAVEKAKTKFLERVLKSTKSIRAENREMLVSILSGNSKEAFALEDQLRKAGTLKGI